MTNKAVLQASILNGGSTVTVGASAAIEVRTPAGALASVYGARDGTGTPGNPFNADANGYFRVYLDPGRYRVIVTTASGSQTFEDVVVFDDTNPNQASTAQGGSTASDGANTWAKLAEFTLAGDDQTGGAFYTLMPEASGSGPMCILSVKLDTTTGSHDASNCEIIVHALNNGTVVSASNFKIVGGATAGNPLALWVKKNTDNQKFLLKELSKTGFSSITYSANAAWQSTEPTGAFEVVSTISSLTATIGAGQTWATVTGSRIAGTAYTNGDRPIMVTVRLSSDGTGTVGQVRSDGGSTWITLGASGGTALTNISFIVPPLHQYRVSGTATIQSWAELS